MADLVPLDPFSLIKPRSQPDDPLGYLWQQVGNVGRATFGVPLANTIPRPMLGQQYPDAWGLMPRVAGMLSPYLAARDTVTSLSEANRAAAAGDVWGAAENLGIGALNAAALVPPGRGAKTATELAMLNKAMNAARKADLATDAASRAQRMAKQGYEAGYWRGGRSVADGPWYTPFREAAENYARRHKQDADVREYALRLKMGGGCLNDSLANCNPTIQASPATSLIWPPKVKSCAARTFSRFWIAVRMVRKLCSRSLVSIRSKVTGKFTCSTWPTCVTHRKPCLIRRCDGARIHLHQ